MTVPADPAAALLAVLQPFGVTAEELEESADDLAYAAAVDPAKVPARADLGRLLQRLRDDYGTSITFHLATGELPLCALRPDDAAPFLDRYDDIVDAATLELSVRIDKEALLDHWGFDDPSCAFRLFLFPRRLAEALEAPLHDLVKPRGLLHDFTTKSKLILLVPAHPIEWYGPFLAVLGGPAVDSWRQCAAAPALPDVYGHARRLLKWVHFDLEPVTPLHLAIDPGAAPPAANDLIGGRLFALWATCSILYLADHSRWDDNAQSWLVTFPAEKFSVTAHIGAGAVRTALDPAGERARLLGRLVVWAYEEEKQIADRLTTIQNVVANVLEEDDAAANGPKLIRHAEEISRRVEGAWKAFISQKLDKYFGQVKQLEETIDSTSRAYDEQIQTLTKSLTDNMLAAVAVVVGSFIAAMFKSPFQPYVFWFGAGVYLLYLVLFPVGVGLTATLKRFTASRKAFTKRTMDFGRRITEDEVRQIVGDTVTNREKAFVRWFIATVILYVTVIGALGAAMVLVPPLIEKWSDEFTLTDVDYGAQTPDGVLLLLHGTNFDRNKEIVAIVGSSVYSNSAKTLTVYGSSLLTITVPERDLPARGQTKNLPVVTVRQGRAEVKRTLDPR